MLAQGVEGGILGGQDDVITHCMRREKSIDAIRGETLVGDDVLKKFPGIMVEFFGNFCRIPVSGSQTPRNSQAWKKGVQSM